jgi:hypothetical protein
MKKWWSCLTIFLVVAITIGGITTQTWASEKGKFRCLGVLHTTKYEELKVPDIEKDILFQAEDDGLIFNQTGGMILHNARYQVVYNGVVTKGVVNLNCIKTFTMPDGSQIFAKCEGKGSGNRGNGNWTLIGGTGKYEGIKGNGTYDWTGVTDQMGWDILEGEYEIP